MLLQFQTAELRDLCEDQSVAEKEFGEESTYLFSALADIRAADSLASVPPALVDVIDAQDYSFATSTSNLRVLFIQNHRKPPLSANGNLDMKRVTRIKITRVERAND